MIKKLMFVGMAIMLVGIIVFGTGAIVKDKTVNPDFATDSITISLTHEATLEFLDYTPEDFDEVDATEIVELSTPSCEWVEENIFCTPSDDVLENINDYKRIFNIKFDKKSKHDMIEAVEILQSREDVEYAGLNYPVLTPEAQKARIEAANDILKIGAIFYGVGLLVALTFLIANRRKN